MDTPNEERSGIASRFPAPNLLKHAIRVLNVYRWTWISVTVLLMLGVGVAVFTVTPRYRAECMVLIEPGKMNITEFKDVYDPTMTQNGARASRDYTETQFHLMLSEPVLEQVFMTFGFASHERFANDTDPIASFADYFNVEPIRNTRLARVTFEWEDAELAARALSLVVKTYIEEYRRRRLGVTAEGLAALRAKAAELRPEVEAKAAALETFKAKHNIVSLEEDEDIVKERLRETSTNLTDVESRRIKLESRVANISDAISGKRPLDDLPEVLGNQAIRDLKLEWVRLEQTISANSDRFGMNHPEMRRARGKLQAVKARINGEISSILAAAKADLDRVRSQEKQLARTLTAQEERVMVQSRFGAQYGLLKDAYESANQNHRSIIKRIEEIEITSAAGTKGDNVFEIAAPKVPTRPSFPKKKQSILLAAALGLALGMGLSFLLNALDGSIKSMEDVEQELGLAVLGHVPASDDVDNADLAALEKPRGLFAESFRSLRTAMSLASAGGGLKRILVTSPSPSEGKDLVSLNTAISLAQSGKRVLLLDCDLRRPRQHKVFGMSPLPGLSNLLASSDEMDPRECMRDTPVENLTLMPSGPVPPNPVELISSPRMADLLDRMGDRFDVIVVNSPPVLAVSDPVVLTQLVQGVMVVIRGFSTRLDDARRTLEVLDRAEANVLGAVLNLVDTPKVAGGRYYGYSTYGYYDYSANTDTRGARERKRVLEPSPAAAFEPVAAAEGVVGRFDA